MEYLQSNESKVKPGYTQILQTKCCTSSKFLYWYQIHNVMVLGGGVFGRRFGHEGAASWMRSIPPWMRLQGAPSLLPVSEDTVRRQSLNQEAASKGTEFSNVFILDAQPCEKSVSVVISYPVYCIFVVAVYVDLETRLKKKNLSVNFAFLMGSNLFTFFYFLTYKLSAHTSYLSSHTSSCSLIYFLSFPPQLIEIHLLKIYISSRTSFCLKTKYWHCFTLQLSQT